MNKFEKLCTLAFLLLHSTSALAQSIVPPSWVAPPPRDTISQYPYCTSFELEDSLWFQTRTRGLGLGSFVRGNPQKTRISSARTGNAAWFIGPQGDYNNFDSSVLYLPAFEVQKDSTYLIQFYANWSMDFFPSSGSPMYGDGFTMERHLGTFESWENFGSLDTVEPSSWYNAAVFALRNFSLPPNNFGFGWTNRSQGYELQQHFYKAQENGILRMRFRFGSDDAFTGEGVAIDDFCFQKISSISLGTSNQIPEGLPSVMLYPNPSAGSSIVLIQTNQSELIHFAITNALGQLIYSKQADLESGANRLDISLPVPSPGLYFVQWQTAKGGGQLRWVVQ